ncbi:MAG: hypothetical protein SangKO_054470 [Sandaracinaceae bacterium]|nr:MAG: hypothetical protein EVA89_36320 [Sandaracinaceae bacterium]
MNAEHPDAVWREAFTQLRATLGQEGWTVYRSRNGVKARWRWLSVGLKHKPTRDGAPPWRARLRDGFPRYLVTETRADEPLAALGPVIEEARDVARFCDGRLGLVANPSKSWLGHRVWQAVRPVKRRK